MQLKNSAKQKTPGVLTQKMEDPKKKSREIGEVRRVGRIKRKHLQAQRNLSIKEPVLSGEKRGKGNGPIKDQKQGGGLWGKKKRGQVKKNEQRGGKKRRSSLP